MGKGRNGVNGGMAEAAAGYLGYLGCPVSAGRDGLRRVTLKKRIRGLKALAVEFGDKPVIDDALGIRVLRMAVANGGWTVLRMVLVPTDDELLDICTRHAASLGLSVDSARIHREPGRMLLACFTVTQLAHTRRDRLYAFKALGDGAITRVGWAQVMKSLESGSMGWLGRADGPGESAAPHAPDEWCMRTLEAVRQRAVSLARRDLWLFGKMQRDLLAEEERLLRLHYSELSNEFLEPLRRLHMRISEANERRNQARSMKSAQAGAAELRKLKGLAGEEEARLRESRVELQGELEEQLIEARRRYSLGSRLATTIVSLVLHETPVLRMPGMDLHFNPFTGAPSRLVWTGGAIPLDGGTKLRVCGWGHVHNESGVIDCACGAMICPECGADAGQPMACTICGEPACPSCMPVCRTCSTEAAITAKAFESQ